jgi:hypothetical protein
VIRILIAVVVALAAALPAAASTAEVDPSRLVLRHADVPAGFQVDADDTGVRTNAREAKSEPRFKTLLQRWGRVTGYEVEFDRADASIGSRADVLRTAKGAEQMLDWYLLEVRKIGIRGFIRTQLELGDEGWMYRSRTPAQFTIVTWRSGRVFAGLGTTGLTNARTRALAQKQQRRIAAALR